MSKKKELLEHMFRECERKGNMRFTNEEVKLASKDYGFANHNDLTHIDSPDKLPENLQKENYFPVRLGKGKYEFVQGIKFGYHEFEDIEDIVPWRYKKNILDEINSSESNLLSVIVNQRIIHDFLYEDIRQNPNVYGSHRTQHTFMYYLGDKKMSCSSLQIEIDTTLENSGRVTVIEAKNKFRKQFAIYQLYHPFRIYYDLYKQGDIMISDDRHQFEIETCYIVRDVNENGISIIRCYLYVFEDPDNISSIKLKRATQYELVSR